MGPAPDPRFIRRGSPPDTKKDPDDKCSPYPLASGPGTRHQGSYYLSARAGQCQLPLVVAPGALVIEAYLIKGSPQLAVMLCKVVV